MHNVAAKNVNILEICKKFAGNLLNGHGIRRQMGIIPRFSNLEVIDCSIS